MMTKSAPMPVLANEAIRKIITPVIWRERNARRVLLAITTDEDRTVSAVALNLPGAGSCGSTEEEAIANAREAIRGVLEVYREDGETVPWMDTTSLQSPPGAKRKWITVDE